MNKLIESNIPIDKSFSAWISPNGQLIIVPEYKHANYIKTYYPNYLDMDDLFNKAFNDGWIRVIYTSNGHLNGNLSLNGNNIKEIKKQTLKHFNDIIKYGNNRIDIAGNNENWKTFNLPTDKEEFYKFLSENKTNEDKSNEIIIGRKIWFPNMNENETTNVIFDINQFEQLRSFAAKIRYAEQTLKKIAQGSGRIVYEIDDKTVLKLAKNAKGVAQNETEEKIGRTNSYVSNIVTEVFKHDPNYTWIVSEKAKKITPSRFKQLTGVDIKNLEYFLRNYENQKAGLPKIFGLDKEVEEELWNNEFSSEIANLIPNYNIMAGDLGKTSSYGEVIRDGQPQVVLTDYGLNRDVFQKHYSWDRKKRFDAYNRRFESVNELSNTNMEDELTNFVNPNEIRDGGYAGWAMIPNDGLEDGTIDRTINEYKVESHVGWFDVDDRLAPAQDELFIAHLQVSDQYRGQGKFKELLNDIIEFAKQHDKKAIVLEPDITQGKEYTEFLSMLYKKYGFVPYEGDPSLLIKTIEQAENINEDAITNISNLALEIDGNLYILYDPRIASTFKEYDFESAEKYIYGVIDLRFNDKQNAYEVERVIAQQGYGPIMYMIALSAAGNKGLMPTRLRGKVSEEAKNVWKNFYDGKGKQYIKNMVDLKFDDEYNQAYNHPEDYLNKKYIITKPVNTYKIYQNNEKILAHDPYGEKKEFVIEAAESVLQNKMRDLYHEQVVTQLKEGFMEDYRNINNEALKQSVKFVELIRNFSKKALYNNISKLYKNYLINKDNIDRGIKLANDVNLYYANLMELQKWFKKIGLIKEDFIKEDLVYQHVTDASPESDSYKIVTEDGTSLYTDKHGAVNPGDIPFELQEELTKRIISWMPKMKSVKVKQHCRLGGNKDGTSDACNTGDIDNLEIKDIVDGQSHKPNTANVAEDGEKWFESKKLNESLRDLPVWNGIGYRVPSGFRERNATAADVIKFEMEEHGNVEEYQHLDKQTMEELNKYSFDDIVWVTKTKKDATRYGNIEDIESIQITNGRLIAEDGDGGYLVLITNGKNINETTETKSNILKEEKIEYGCLMAYFEIPKWKNIISKIKEEDLYDDGSGTFGREDEPHISILYGYHDEVKADDFKEIIDKIDKPIEVELTGISLFENPEFDVVKIDVTPNEELIKLRKEIEKFPNTLTYKEFHPHMTIAYVKKGKGKKYVHDFKNPIKLESDLLVFSSKKKNQVQFPIEKKGITESENIKNNIDVYDYQDTHAERILEREWNNNVWKYKIENAGDILRELAKYNNTFLDPSYIFEKVNKIEEFIVKQKKGVHPDDSYYTLKTKDNKNLNDMKKAYELQPVMSEAQEHARQLILYLIDGNLNEVQKQIDYFNKLRAGDTKANLHKVNVYRNITESEDINQPDVNKYEKELNQDKNTNGLNKKLITTVRDRDEEVKVCAVNGDYVKRHYYMDWTEGGNHYAGTDNKNYEYIPENEVWIDDVFLSRPEDLKGNITHELLERYLMKYYKYSYDNAHEIANRIEKEYREKLANKNINGEENINEGIYEINAMLKDKNETLESFVDKIAKKLNLNKPKYLNAGTYGYAFDVGNNIILKVTLDYSEATEGKILLNKKNEHLADIYAVYKFNIDSRNQIYIILLEKLKTDRDKINNLNEEAKEKYRIGLWGLSYIMQDHDIKKLNEYKQKIEILKSIGKNIEVVNFLDQIIKIIEELLKNKIYSADFGASNLGYKPNGNLAYFDIGAAFKDSSRRLRSVKPISVESKNIVLDEEDINEYTIKIKNELINKFKQENSTLTDNIINYYINRFEEFKNSPKIKEKDIFKYTWKELEQVIDAQKTKIKTGKPEITGADAIYNKNGLRIYAGSTQKACIKYGNGYSWCISARGEGNMYGAYRFEGDYKTPYFVFDDTRNSEQNQNGSFVDPLHAIVIMINHYDKDEDYNDIEKYSITTANNDGEKNYFSFNEIEEELPKLKGLEYLFQPINPTEIEKKEHEIGNKYQEILNQFNNKNYNTNYNLSVTNINTTVDYIDNKILNDKIKKIKFIGELKNPEEFPDEFKKIEQTYFISNKYHFEEALETFKNTLFNNILPKDKKIEDIFNITYEEIIPNKEYFEKIKEIILQYRNELTKLNIKENTNIESKNIDEDYNTDYYNGSEVFNAYYSIGISNILKKINNYKGYDIKNFINNIFKDSTTYKYPFDNKFLKSLNDDNKKRIIKRLADFYNQRIKPKTINKNINEEDELNNIIDFNKLNRGVDADDAIYVDKFPIKYLTVSKRGIIGAIYNIKNNNSPSQTNEPVSVFYNINTKKFLVSDGYHRVAQAYLNKEKTIPVNITSDVYSNYIANIPDENKFKLESTKNINENTKSPLSSLKTKLAEAAQKVYNEWEQNEEGYCDYLGYGGICQDIAEAICNVLSNNNIECTTVSQQIGDQHVYAVAKLEDGIYIVDIPPYSYETGGGYCWKKIPDVIFDEEYILIDRISADPEEFEEYIGENKKINENNNDTVDFSDEQIKILQHQWSFLDDQTKEKYKNIMFNLVKDRKLSIKNKYILYNILDIRKHIDPNPALNNKVPMDDNKIKYFEKIMSQSKPNLLIKKILYFAKKNKYISTKQSYYLYYWLKTGATPYEKGELPQDVGRIGRKDETVNEREDFLEKIKTIKINDIVPEDIIYQYIQQIHWNDNDWSEGDISDRIEQYKNYILKEVSIDKIDIEEFQTYEDIVKKYADQTKNTGYYPPIVIAHDYQIIDGTHRAQAIEMLGMKTILAFVGTNKNTNENLNEANILSLDQLPFKNEVEKNGGKIYGVGGKIRDELLGKESKDLDILITGIPLDKLAQILSHYGKVSEVGKSFGIIKFKPQGSEEDIDIAIPRSEKPTGEGGHKGFDVTSDHNLSIETDLSRRDYSINAIAKDTKGNIIDPYHGVDDLKNKIIRVVNPQAFSDDPLRMLRGVGFASRFNFTIEPETMKLIQQNASRIKEISPERILIELDKIVHKGNKILGAELLKETGLFEQIFGRNIGFNRAEPWDKIKSLGEYVFMLTKNIIDNPAYFYKNNLKGDDDNTNEIEVLKMAFDGVSDVPAKNRLIVFNMNKISSRTLDSNLLPPQIKNAVNDLKSGKYPLSLQQLAINGNDLLALGMKGKQIGETLKTLLIKVYTDQLPNNKGALLSFINENIDKNDINEGNNYTNDIIKDQFAKKNNIKLLRIPYYEFKNIENILFKII